MDWSEIIGYAATAVGGGGLVQLFNWRLNKKKAGIEVKASEVETMAAAMREVYEPLVERQQKEIDRQSEKITKLETQIEEMKKQHLDELNAQRAEREKMQEYFENRILELTKLVQSNSNYPPRGKDGKFTKND